VNETRPERRGGNWRPLGLWMCAAGLAAGLLLHADPGDLAEHPSGPIDAHAARSAPEEAVVAPEHRGALLARAESPEQVRSMVAFCDHATAADRQALRRVALEAEDPLCAGNAIRALGRLQRLADDPDLVRLLHDPRPRVRDETILALGESERSSSIEALSPLLRDPEPKVRVLAARSIARIRQSGTLVSSGAASREYGSSSTGPVLRGR
jgi:hypothetical protein